MLVVKNISRFARKPWSDQWRAMKATVEAPFRKPRKNGREDGSFSTPSRDFDMSQHPWFKAAKRALTLAFPGGLEGRRIVDLGCLEGVYTTEFARLGMEALGIEVRRSNFEKCLAVKAAADLPNLSFVHDNVWHLAKYGKFDAVFCSGLLYHLDRPREFIRIASGACKTICLYQTHFATPYKIDKFNLSPVMENEGLKGRWYKEHAAISTDELEKLIWSSWENKSSFWLLREEILGCIHDNDFDMVFEQYDCLLPPLGKDFVSLSTEISTIAQEMTEGYYRTDNRCLFVGVRTGIV